MTDQPVASARDLTKRFEESAGVFDVDLDLSGGEIVALIGPSGSGKTTTVRLLTGLLAPDSGSVSVFGQDPQAFTAATRRRIGYMAQESVFFPDLTLRENLNFAASLFGVPLRRRQRVDAIVELLGLGEAIDRLLRDVSGGEKRRLSLAAALIHEPDLLFLDEPTAGIDPILRRRFWEHFEELADQRAAMLVTTQYVGEAAYCDYVGVLSAGRVLAFETPDGLRRRAFGGELLDVVLTTPPAPGDLDRLARTPEVETIRWLDDHSVRLVVDDAGAMAATVVEWAGEVGLEIDRSEPFLPPFDDVFVEIVSAATGSEEASDEPLAVVGS
ncbi:MAG TPA: ABC transporter ATP-binding protein [Acidimicrobiia bacterium]|nr:ABC transporter ATP-binding protein [Acidimicrobiia bacterium]